MYRKRNMIYERSSPFLLQSFDALIFHFFFFFQISMYKVIDPGYHTCERVRLKVRSQQ